MAERLESLEDILSRFQFKTEDLKRRCSKEHRREIAVKVSDSNAVNSIARALRQLEFSTKESEPLNCINLLDDWAKEREEDATYLNLALAFHAAQREDLIEAMCNILVRHDSSLSEGIYCDMTLKAGKGCDLSKVLGPGL